MGKKFYCVFTNACLLLIGAGILSRFLLLGNGYEYDELYTAITANPNLSLGYIWDNYLMVDVHPPLYNIVLWIYNHFVPYGPELWMRLPSVIFGILGMILAWVLFPKRYSKLARLIFMAFLSCNFWFVLYAQHARAYSMLFCIAVPFNYLFINMAFWVRKGKQIGWKHWAWYGVLGVLLCWTHYFGAMAFGFFSLALLGYAFRYKRNLWPFILVPAVVTLLFLPWAVPNLLYNAGDNKFNGNWWAKGYPMVAAWWHIIEFYFINQRVFLVVSLLFSMCLWKRVQLHKKGKPNPYIRDIALFSWVGLSMMGFVFLISLKMFVFFGRYFMAIVPGLLTAFSLCIAPCVRKERGFAWWTLLALVCFIGFGIHTSHYTTSRLYAGAKAAMEFYRDYAPEKELFVAPIEGFPPNTTRDMYAFYPKYVLKMDKEVTALTRLPKKELNEALARKENALIWMPHCNPYKLRMLAIKWDRTVGIEGYLGTSCFIRFGEEGEVEPPAEWKKVHRERFELERNEDGSYRFPEGWKEMEIRLFKEKEAGIEFFSF